MCPRCGGYFRMHAAYRRIEMLIDEGTFEEWDKEISWSIRLHFRAMRARLRQPEKTDLMKAVITGKGKIHGYETVIVGLRLPFPLMCSMGHNMGEKIARAVERA